MASNEPDKNEEEAGGGFIAIVGVFILGMVCCAAGPVAVLAGVAGIRAWFSGLHPFLVALFALVAAIFAIVWISRKRGRLRSEPNMSDIRGSNENTPEKIPISKITSN